ncbi:MAG: heme-binding protein [Actinobacteria bacterium]|nr:heme-binding protein [Actinomycetota bacterium]
MAQEQKYTVVAARDGYEVRHYQTCVVAEVKVVGEFDAAGSRAFGSLFRFISGANGASEKISMTAPVIQRSSQSTRLQVWDEHVISFVMPADMKIADTPLPTDSHVELREVSDQLVAALRFSGRMTVENFESNTRRLQECLVRDGYIQSDVARLARFNAPWTPGFMRRNEIQIPVVVATK